jgi:hypothetical protein
MLSFAYSHAQRLLPLALALAIVIGLATQPGTSAAESSNSDTPAAGDASSRADEDGLSLRGGEEGTAFRSLTVEGEDRIHIEFERPTLDLELDPALAPGLDWGSAHDVLDRTLPDLFTPFLAVSADERTPYLGHPWLGQLRSGAVATFQLEMEDVERWQFVVANSRGETVVSFDGRGKPPRELQWDGRSASGTPADPGRTYSTVFEAYDRAGNKRTLIGDPFQIQAYRLETPEGPVMVFSGKEIVTLGGGLHPDNLRRKGGASMPPLLYEAASWINQSPQLDQPYQIIAIARSYEQADALATNLVRILTPLVLGEPGRLRAQTQVESDAPERGTVMITPAGWNESGE